MAQSRPEIAQKSERGAAMPVRTVSRISFVIPALLAVVLAGACGKSSEGAASLPPASGEGAPPRAALPALDQRGGDSPVESATRTTTGTTHPRASAQIAPNMSGVLAMVAVEAGDRVKKGDLLFRLRGEDFDLRVQQAQAALKSAEVQLTAVKVEYDRTQRLFEKNAINQATWDQVQAQYQGTQVGVEAARVALAMAQKARADATVRSPIAGVVTAKLKSPGEMVTMMPPSVVVVVEDHSVLELRFRLPEGSLSMVQVGDVLPAQFTAAGFSRDVKVTRISPNVDPMTRTIEVIAELPNPDGQLKAGMLAELAFSRAGAEAAPAAGDAAGAKSAEAEVEAGQGTDSAAASATAAQEVAKP
jgi:RND family efflux transporter MFP subunit